MSAHAATARLSRIAIVVSPRDWAERLHRHLADHGGALVRARILDSREALDEDYDVLVCEDLTSFLTPRLVGQLHHRGRRVLGLHDPRDEAGRRRLHELDVDAVASIEASPDTLLQQIDALSVTVVDLDDQLRRLVEQPPDDVPGAESPRAGLVVVGGPSGGPGATEVAIGIADAWSRSATPATLLDADTVAPSVSQRLGLPLEPNIRSALDRLDQGEPVEAALHRVDDLRVCAGVADPRDWRELRPAAVVDLVAHLQTSRPVIADVGHRLEAGTVDTVGGGRHDVARALTGAADVVVGTVAAHPVGVARLLDWLADVRSLTSVPIHVVINRVPRRDRWAREQVEVELARTIPVSATWPLAELRSVSRAAWDGRLPTDRTWRRTLHRIAGALSQILAEQPAS